MIPQLLQKFPDPINLILGLFLGMGIAAAVNMFCDWVTSKRKSK